MNQTYYAAYKYETVNIGDDIQTYAAQSFFPRIDRYIFRDRLNAELTKLTPGCIRSMKMIINGWYSHSPRDFYPRDAGGFRPLCISMHFSDKHGSSTRTMFEDGLLAKFLRDNQPIGCRDVASVELLQRHGVEAYFSGCLTLTLKLPPRQKRDDLVIVSDCKVPAHLLESISANVVHRTHGRLPMAAHRLAGWLNRFDRFHEYKRQVAAATLQHYQQARLVITSRLHCALPCLALGTDVVFVHDDASDPRFTGYEEILRITKTNRLNGSTCLGDLFSLKCNAAGVQSLRNSLVQKVSGYLSGS